MSESESGGEAYNEGPKTKLKKRAKAAAMEAKEEVDYESESSGDDASFQYKYDEKTMLGDAADREFMDDLPEVKREAELTRRFEEYDIAKSRWEIARKIKADQRAKNRAKARSTADAGRSRRSTSQAQDKKSRAIDELRDRRKKAARRSARAEEVAQESDSPAEEEEEEEEEEDEYTGWGEDARRVEPALSDEEQDRFDDREAVMPDLLTCRLSRHKVGPASHGPIPLSCHELVVVVLTVNYPMTSDVHPPPAAAAAAASSCSSCSSFCVLLPLSMGCGRSSHRPKFLCRGCSWSDGVTSHFSRILSRIASCVSASASTKAFRCIAAPRSPESKRPGGLLGAVFWSWASRLGRKRLGLTICLHAVIQLDAHSIVDTSTSLFCGASTTLPSSPSPRGRATLLFTPVCLSDNTELACVYFMHCWCCVRVRACVPAHVGSCR